MRLTFTPAHLATAPSPDELATTFPILASTDAWDLPEWLARALNGQVPRRGDFTPAAWNVASNFRPFLLHSTR